MDRLNFLKRLVITFAAVVLGESAFAKLPPPQCDAASVGRMADTANIPVSDMPAGFLHTTTTPSWIGFLRRSSSMGGDGKAAATAKPRYRWAKIRGAYRLSRRNIARIVAAKAVLS